MRSPAFQFYAADYLADERVQLMTLEEEGAYIRLLSYCWREGSIPIDDVYLSRLCKGASTTVLAVVKKCFNRHPEDGSRMVHKRLEEEREKQEEWSRKSREGGLKSAETKRNKERQGWLKDRGNGGTTLQLASTSASSKTAAAEKQQQEVASFPESHGYIRGKFPTSTDLLADEIVAVGRDEDPLITDGEFVGVLEGSLRKNQTSAVLWRDHTVRPFMQQRAKRLAKDASTGSTPTCKRCGDRRKIFNPKFNGRPNSEWIDLPESEWDIPCPDCAGEPASVPPGTARARDPAHMGGRRAAER